MYSTLFSRTYVFFRFFPFLVITEHLVEFPVLWRRPSCLSVSYNSVHSIRASLEAQTVKQLPIMRETRIRSLGREDPLEKEMATHSSVLAWRIPWMEEPGELYIVHGVAKSRTRLSGFRFTFIHSSVGKESACNAGDLGSILGSGRSPGEGNGSSLQYSCLENPMDRGAWRPQSMRLQESDTT